MTNRIIKEYLESGKYNRVNVVRIEDSGNYYRVTFTGFVDLKPVSLIQFLTKEGVADFAARMPITDVIESKPAELSLFDEDTDRERLIKYFKSIQELPSLESSKARKLTGAYFDDLRTFIGKWERTFGI